MSGLLPKLATLAMTAGLATQPAFAQSGAEYFDGKTITYIVATDPGGGYDTYGRLVAEYLQKYLPGSTIVVRNMPGAGHIIGANAIFGSEPDGLTIGTFNTGLIYNQLSGTEGIKFDLPQMSWIGKAASDARVIVVGANSNIADFAALAGSKGPVKFGTAGVGSSDYVDAIMLKTALNLPMDIINGYGGNENILAMKRGEVQAAIGYRSSFEQFIGQGDVKPVAQIGGKHTDVPQLVTFATTDQGKQVIGLIQSQSTIARLTVGPPGIPDDILKTLREAYGKALADPELRAKAEKSKLPIDPLVGDEVASMIKAQFELSPESVALIKELLTKK